MSRLEKEDVRAILSVFDKDFDNLIKNKQKWLTNKIAEAVQELAPRFKNHAIVIIESPWQGMEIRFYKLRDVPPRTESLFNTDLPYHTFHDEYYLYHNTVRGLPLFEEFDKIINFWVLSSNLGSKEFNLNKVIEVRGDFQPDDEEYGVPSMYREK